MRRPSFLWKRSKSVPTIAWADIPAEEAGIIFSAAEKAAARRRRPKSEYNPSSTYWEQVPAIQWPRASSPAASTEVPYPTGLNSNPFVSETPETASPQTPQYEDQSPKCQEASYSDDEPAEDQSIIDLDMYTPPALSSPPPSFESHRSTLRDYAASLRQFTQNRLEIVVPQVPHKPSRPVVSHTDSYFTCLSPPETPQTSRITPLQRPELISRFSDWSQTSDDDDDEADAEMDFEVDPFSQFMPAPQTPKQSPRVPESLSCEPTPRVGHFRQEDRSLRNDSFFTGEPGPCVTQSDHQMFGASSLLSVNAPSPFKFEPRSYFDAWSTDNSTASSPWPLKPSVEDTLRNSLQASSLSQLLAPLSLDSPLHSPGWLRPMVS